MPHPAVGHFVMKLLCIYEVAWQETNGGRQDSPRYNLLSEHPPKPPPLRRPATTTQPNLSTSVYRFTLAPQSVRSRWIFPSHPPASRPDGPGRHHTSSTKTLVRWISNMPSFRRPLLTDVRLTVVMPWPNGVGGQLHPGQIWSRRISSLHGLQVLQWPKLLPNAPGKIRVGVHRDEDDDYLDLFDDTWVG